MASLRSWRDFVLVAKPRVNTIEWRNREELNWRGVELNFTQGFAARDFPRGRAEIDHTYKSPAVGLEHMRIKWRTHHQQPLAHESHQLRRLTHGNISLTPHDDSCFNPVLISFSNDVQLETAGNQFDVGPFEFV